MISLDQIKKLDAKVTSAVRLIDELRKENNSLKEKLGSYQSRIEELEVLISDFKEDQGEIEEGIVHALEQLEQLGVQSETEEKAVTPSAEPGSGEGLPMDTHNDAPEEVSPPQPTLAPENTVEYTGEDNSGEEESAEEEIEFSDESEEAPSTELDIF